MYERRGYFGEDIGNLLLTEIKPSLKDVIRLSDELHVSVFDTVVYHLDVMAGTCRMSKNSDSSTVYAPV